MVKVVANVLRGGRLLLLMLGVSFLASCGEDGSDPIAAPGVPTGVTAAPENGAATVRWSSVGGAATYNLYIASQAGVTKGNYLSLTGGRKQTGITSPFTQTGLTNVTTYYIVITAENSGGESAESTEIRITPAPPAPVGVVAGGGTHTVVLKTNGMVWSWGRNGAGQIGDGTTTRRLTPVQVNGLTGISDVAAGLDHTLALKADGTVWAWGDNRFGQLGDGTTTNRLYPVQVSGLTEIIAVAGGRNHSLALKSDGTVWAWGDNSSGQLGNNSTTASLTPASVLTEVGAIAAGAFHSVALKDDGTVWFWGDNRHAQFDITGQNQIAPVPVPGLDGSAGVWGGAFHTVAVKEVDRTVWTWGGNGSGQLGNGTDIDQPTPAAVGGLAGVIDIGAGAGHTLAVKLDGTVMAWGDHLFGRNIDGTTIRQLSPVLITGLTGIVRVAGGGFHAVALKDDGSVWTWGDNFTGQLGNGNTSDRFTPVQVMSPIS